MRQRMKSSIWHVFMTRYQIPRFIGPRHAKYRILIGQLNMWEQMK
jgi:hypothetical protein